MLILKIRRKTQQRKQYRKTVNKHKKLMNSYQYLYTNHLILLHRTFLPKLHRNRYLITKSSRHIKICHIGNEHIFDIKMQFKQHPNI